MFKRRISENEVRHVIETGKTIEEYPNDVPYPSRLVLGKSRLRPLHAVVADNAADQETIVVTVYEPAPDEWEQGFKKRKRT